MSYLPPLSAKSISKEIEFIMSKGWVPCLEFDKVQTKHQTCPNSFCNYTNFLHDEFIHQLVFTQKKNVLL